MRIGLLLFLLTYLCLGSHAQIGTLGDTLNILSSEWNMNQRAGLVSNLSKKSGDSLYLYKGSRLRNEWMQQSATQLVADSTQALSLLRFHYSQQKKNFKLPTEADFSSMFGLYTEGVETFGKIKITGRFNYEMDYEDSLPNNLSEQSTPDAPFTYFATKAGQYRRQMFNAMAGGTYALLPVLYAGYTADYDYHHYYGLVDPRVDITFFHLLHHLSLTYKLDRSYIGFTYLTGHIDETIGTTYKSKMFSNSELYPERKLYINDGYGYISRKSAATAAYTKSYTKENGWRADFSTVLSGWSLKGFLQHLHTDRENFIQYDSSSKGISTKNIHSQYKKNTNQIQALFFKENERLQHWITLEAEDIRGNGYLTEIPLGTNYRYRQHTFAGGYQLVWKKNGNVDKEIGMDAHYVSIDKMDYLSYHHLTNKVLKAVLSIGKYWHMGDNMWTIRLSPGIIKPLDGELSVPENQVNEFTRSIAYPEYDYRASTFSYLHGEVAYLLKKFWNKTSASFFLNFNHQYKLQGSDLPSEVYSPIYKGKSQYGIHIGFQIYL